MMKSLSVFVTVSLISVIFVSGIFIVQSHPSLSVINVFFGPMSTKKTYTYKSVYFTREENDNVLSGKHELVSDKISITEKKFLNYRPIIGILSQELSKRMQETFKHSNYTSYIAASYVKFIESAGARVVPVLINQDDDYYEHLGQSLNGFLFPGGSLPLDSEYSKSAKKVFDIVKRSSSRSNNHDEKLALWTTCLGFEYLLCFESGSDLRSACNAYNKGDPLHFKSDSEQSQLFGSLPNFILNDLASRNITANFHQKCVLPKNFYRLGLNESMKLLSTSFDRNGVEYVSTVEYRHSPIFGTQWHPEKAAFEWSDDKHHNAIPHSIEAVRAAQSVAEVFVQKARENRNHFTSQEEEQKSLIYNFSPVYVAEMYESSFQLCYYFK